MKFSVVVVTRNRPGVLAETLEALTPEAQAVPSGSFEVIVGDDSDDDATRTLVGRRFPWVTYVSGARRGPGANRNAAAGAAKGEWLAFIDDDCRPAPGWLRALERVGAERASDVIEGRIVSPGKTDNPFRQHAENLTGGVFWTGNIAIRRAVFNRLGRFDEDFVEAGEDMELGHRIVASGVPVVFSQEATVIHPSHPVSLWFLVRRSFQIRWPLLYMLKANRGVPWDGPTWRAVSYLLVNRTATLLRTTWRGLGPGASGQRRTGLFRAAMSWVLFPVLLPYMVWWDLHFRRMLRARARGVLTPTPGGNSG